MSPMFKMCNKVRNTFFQQLQQLVPGAALVAVFQARLLEPKIVQIINNLFSLFSYQTKKKSEQVYLSPHFFSLSASYFEAQAVLHTRDFDEDE